METNATTSLNLSQQEAELLRRVIDTYAAELREEIGKTEKYDFRQSLKGDEEHLKSIRDRLALTIAGKPA